MGNLIHVVLVLLILGVVIYFASPFIPGPILTLVFAVLAIGLLIWLLRGIGGVGGGPAI